jgi:hypothetical protein
MLALFVLSNNLACMRLLLHVRASVAACRSDSAGGDKAVQALHVSCNSLQQLVHAAQQQVQQLEAAAEAASTSAVVACVAAISEDSCKDEQDDDNADDAVDDASMPPAAAAACDVGDRYQTGTVMLQAPDEIECLSDDEQYCVQSQMGAQVAAWAGLQPAAMTDNLG